MLDLGYNSEVEMVNDTFEEIEDGKYEVIVSDVAAPYDNKKRTGKVLKIVFKVLSGKNVNRLIFVYYNIQHDNDKVQEIARSNFSQFHAACGIQSLRDLSVLIGKKLFITKFTKNDFTNYRYNKLGNLDKKTSKVAELEEENEEIADETCEEKKCNETDAATTSVKNAKEDAGYTKDPQEHDADDEDEEEGDLPF